MLAFMARSLRSSASETTDLRRARKAFTRAHICEAARKLFVLNGYAATTMGQIGKAAGAPRSTLYTHFSDKETILDAIADDYIDRLRPVLARVPSPKPARAEIRIWIAELADLIRDDRMPTVLFNGIGTGLDMPKAVRRIGESVIAMLANRLPAFAYAATEGPQQNASRAYAQVAVRELSLCCQTYALLADDTIGQHYLNAAADIFHRFIMQPYAD
ncbi:MAG: hypothetical protein RLZZ136_903 [Pseudomonadota bacterium]